MKIIDKWGSGILRILRECSEYGLPEPELIDFDADFRVNMYRQSESTFWNNDITTQTTQSPTQTDCFRFTNEDKAVLALVYKQPQMTQKELVLEYVPPADL